MDIIIQLAGVQLGPYSEKQVREHLAEGLLAPTDPARHEGMDNWTPLREVLAKLASPSHEKVAHATPGQPPAIPASNEEAEAKEAATTPAPEENLPEPVPIESPDLPPKRAPADPGVTHLPMRRQDSGTLGRKTVLIGPSEPTPPTVPPVRTRSGHVASSLAQTAPLGGIQQSKRVSRASLVKALAQNTSPLPNRSVGHPPAHSPPDAPAHVPSSKQPDPSLIPPEQRKASRPALIKALTAKTVPMRSNAAPAAPPAPASSPITSPMPTRLVTHPAASPPSVVSGLTKRLAQMVQPDPGPTSLPPLGEDMEVKTTLIAPPVPPAKKGSAGAEHPAPPAAPSSPVPAAEMTPLESFDEPAPRRSWFEHLLPLVIYACGALALVMLYYVWSPYHAAAVLQTASEAGDPAGLASSVDFDSVRASLKEQVKSQLAQSGLTDAKGNATTASATVLSMLDQSIDQYVTPDGISGLVKKSDSSMVDGKNSVVSPQVAATLMAAFDSQPVSQGLSSLGDFVLARDSAILHLKFRGLSWKVDRIDLRGDMGQPGPSNAAAPIISPVVDTFLERGNAKSKSGDWNGAIADYSQVLAVSPHSSVAFNDRAEALQSKGDLDKAIKDYTQALALDPQMAPALEGRGNAKIARNDLDGAIADYTQAVKIDPTLATAYDSRGNAKTAKDDLDGAIADYSQAITLDPTLASAYSDRGFARQANGNLDGAITDYTKALDLKPKTATAYYSRGLARMSQGNLDAAILDFGKALAFDPKIAGAYYNRGNAKNATHDLEGAIADYTQAIALDPKYSLAYCNRGLTRQSKADFDGAISDYSQALAIDPKIAVAYFNRGLIEVRQNNPDGAIADTTQALYLDPKNCQAYYYRGFAKLSKGNLDGAAADLKQFGDMAPKDHDADYARLYLWLIEKQQNPKADSDQDLSDALESNWNSSPDDLSTKTATFLLGRMNETDYLAAIASPDAKADQGHHCEAYYFIGMKRLLMGDRAAAIDNFQKCVATGEKDYFQYILAQVELQAMATAPAAPTAGPGPVGPPMAKP